MLGLAMINLYTKQEVSTFTHNDDMKGDKKCNNWGGLTYNPRLPRSRSTLVTKIKVIGQTVQTGEHAQTDGRTHTKSSKTLPFDRAYSTLIEIKADRPFTRDTLNAPWLLANRQFQWTGNGHSQLPLAELGKPNPSIDLLRTTGSNGRV